MGSRCIKVGRIGLRSQNWIFSHSFKVGRVGYQCLKHPGNMGRMVLKLGELGNIIFKSKASWIALY